MEEEKKKKKKEEATPCDLREDGILSLVTTTCGKTFGRRKERKVYDAPSMVEIGGSAGKRQAGQEKAFTRSLTTSCPSLTLFSRPFFPMGGGGGATGNF